MQKLTVSTNRKAELVDITSEVQSAVSKMELDDGVVYVFCPHTTAGLTLNENWDPDVKQEGARKG